MIFSSFLPRSFSLDPINKNLFYRYRLFPQAPKPKRPKPEFSSGLDHAFLEEKYDALECRADEIQAAFGGTKIDALEYKHVGLEEKYVPFFLN